MTEETFKKAEKIIGEIGEYKDVLAKVTGESVTKVTIGNYDDRACCFLNANMRKGFIKLLESEIDRLQKEFDAL